MQSAVDATALMISKEASGLTAAQITTKAQAYFNALFTDPEVAGRDVHRGLHRQLRQRRQRQGRSPPAPCRPTSSRCRCRSASPPPPSGATSAIASRSRSTTPARWPRASKMDGIEERRQQADQRLLQHGRLRCRRVHLDRAVLAGRQRRHATRRTRTGCAGPTGTTSNGSLHADNWRTQDRPRPTCHAAGRTWHTRQPQQLERLRDGPRPELRHDQRRTSPTRRPA